MRSGKRTTEPYICDQCGLTFFPFVSSAAKRFCSKKCGGENAKAKPLAERFNEKLMKLESGCWSIGSGHERMYAKLFFNGHQIHGHRLSWELHRGPIPVGMFVCHNCPGGDNRWCVNPEHLFLGTIQDNNADAKAKGRMVNGNAKLTMDKALKIRSLLTSGVNRRQIAVDFNVSPVTVKRIALNKSWTTAA
jgi:hypothetical protein